MHFRDVTLHLVVYRLVQELLNNAIKHAEATEVSLQLQAIPQGFILQYDDNGIGCDIDDLIQSSASMGINGIRERVRAFNGDITIQSSRNEGMHILYKYKRTGIHMMNILIIDDHPVVLDGTKTLLQDLANVHIETEQDSAAVLSRMDTDTFQLFLIDINMKPINGIQLSEMIKKNNQRHRSFFIQATNFPIIMSC